MFKPTCTLPAGVAKDAFPAPYNMKALHISGARLHEVIMGPVPDAATQSHVFAPEGVDQAQGAVVGTKVGRGYLAYVGDVNTEEETAQVILALCGLTD